MSGRDRRQEMLAGIATGYQRAIDNGNNDYFLDYIAINGRKRNGYRTKDDLLRWERRRSRASNWFRGRCTRWCKGCRDGQAAARPPAIARPWSLAAYP